MTTSPYPHVTIPHLCDVDMTLTKQQREAINSVLEVIVNAKDKKGRSVSEVFIELPPKRDLPDYYKVVKRPVAIDTIRGRIRGHKYPTFDSFLRDVAQIFFNAKLYNMQNSIIYEDATKLESLVNTEIEKLNNQGIVEEEELPVLGELPPASNQDEEEESDGEPKAKRQKIDEKDDAGDNDEALSKRRGRPPKVETPDEARMKNILKAIRKVKRGEELIYEPFEKLPNAAEYPDYYEHIKNPMSIALVKKNVKRKVYETGGIDQFVKDVKTIFTNAQFYNENNSSIYKDATLFLGEIDGIVKAEVQRPDAEYQNLDAIDRLQPGNTSKIARTAVSNILHKGVTYTIGDWITIENINDAKHPIIAQIFKTWQNSDGQYWINACWYYFPHQTVHRADRLWIEKEVVKTGQYRDHSINEVIEHCYVMYVTKYIRGRPTKMPVPEEKLYVCESRYNEEQKSFNRIKAWKSCVPEESREECSNYEMTMFPEVQNLKKVVSPLLHLLPADRSLWVNPPTEETTLEPIDRGSINAPPITGNIIVTAPPEEFKDEMKKKVMPVLATTPKVKPPVSTPTPRTSTPTRAEPILPPVPQSLQPLLSQGPLNTPTAFTIPVEVSQDVKDRVITKEGNIVWFPVPPVDPVTMYTPHGIKSHSLEFLAHRMRKLASNRRV